MTKYESVKWREKLKRHDGIESSGAWRSGGGGGGGSLAKAGGGEGAHGVIESGMA